jgi:hypothetical protein
MGYVLLTVFLFMRVGAGEPSTLAGAGSVMDEAIRAVGRANSSNHMKNIDN